MQRAVEFSLVVVILIGAAFLYRSTVARSELTREHERLAEKVGRLPIKDPTKIHLLAIETGDPQQFAWRAYFPANYHYSYSCSSGGGSGSMSEPWEGILRVGVRDVKGQLLIYHRLQQGSGLRGIGHSQVNKLLKEHPEQLKKLRAEQLAKREMMILDPSEALTLIRLALSDEILAEAKGRMSERELKELSAPLEWVRIGPPGFAERERAEASR
jgi:hypothetical protein